MSATIEKARQAHQLKRSKRLRVVSIFALAAVATGLPVYAAYRSDISQAKQRLAANSKVINTACGPIGYADVGQGPPLLMIHGAGGGFDQGLVLARQFGLQERGYRIIAPSRFGFLQTPLPSGDASPAAQADAHACLLDALGIRDKIIVAGGSAGAFSAMQFAIKYPERVSALMLLVPDAWVPAAVRDGAGQDVGGNPFVMNVILNLDFAFWAFIKFAKAEMLSFMGVPKELQRSLTPEENERVTELMGTILPVSERQAGILNDEINHRSPERYALENIHAPTLVIDAADMDTFPGAKYTAEHIPNARFVAFETGGHLLIGHGQEATAAVREFLGAQP